MLISTLNEYTCPGLTRWPLLVWFISTAMTRSTQGEWVKSMFWPAKQRHRGWPRASAWKRDALSQHPSTNHDSNPPLLATLSYPSRAPRCLVFNTLSHTCSILSFQQPTGGIPTPIAWTRKLSPKINLLSCSQLLTQRIQIQTLSLQSKAPNYPIGGYFTISGVFCVLSCSCWWGTVLRHASFLGEATGYWPGEGMQLPHPLPLAKKITEALRSLLPCEWESLSAMDACRLILRNRGESGGGTHWGFLGVC